jgi:tripartite-type tricarboxylate transporter receptor subunit TctC
VTQVDSSPHVVVVHPSLPVTSIGELVKLAKARPGALDYASAGTGIRNAVITVLNTPEVNKRLVDMSSTIIGNQPEEFGAFVKSEVDTLAKLVTKLNLTAESIR